MKKPLPCSFIDQFHILRHFSQIDEDYRKEIKDATGFTDEVINRQLVLSGSKFHPDFVKNPVQLWKKIQSHEKFSYPDIREWKEQRFVIILFYNKEDYPDGVGKDSLLRLDDLLPDEKSLLQKQERDGFLVNLVQVTRKNPTWQVNVVLWKEPELIVKTIFPGIYAPPFPDPELQKKAELIDSMRFWDKYALIS